MAGGRERPRSSPTSGPVRVPAVRSRRVVGVAWHMSLVSRANALTQRPPTRWRRCMRRCDFVVIANSATTLISSYCNTEFRHQMEKAFSNGPLSHIPPSTISENLYSLWCFAFRIPLLSHRFLSHALSRINPNSFATVPPHLFLYLHLRPSDSKCIRTGAHPRESTPHELAVLTGCWGGTGRADTGAPS